MHTRYSKHIALFAIILSTLFYSFNGIGAQDIELQMVSPTHINNQTTREYRKDAARLALSHLANGRSLLELDVRIPEGIQKSIFNALMHIHDSNNPYARKVTTLGIHTQPKPYYIDAINIGCSPDAKWVKPLGLGGTSTSSEKINSKLKEYELEIADYNKEENSFVISARNPLNMRKLAKDLSKYDNGIDFIAVPESSEPDHNIEAEHVGGDTWIITFCKGENRWPFKVDGEGRVLYLKK